MKQRALLTLAVAAGLAVAGCGGESGSSGGQQERAASSTRTPSVTATPTSSTPDPAADRRAARAGLIDFDELPSGWQDNDNDPNSAAANCSQIDAVKRSVAARRASGNFSRGNLAIGNTVYVFADEDEADAAFAKLTSTSTRRCLARETAKLISASGQLGDVGEPSSARVRLDDLGDDNDAGRVTLPFTLDGVDYEALIDFGFIRTGRAINNVLYINIDDTFPATLRTRLTSASTDRLAEALAD